MIIFTNFDTSFFGFAHQAFCTFSQLSPLENYDIINSIEKALLFYQ